MSDVEMRTGAGLKGSILVMHRCLLLLFSVPLVPLVLGFGTGKILSRPNILYLWHWCVCAIGQAMNQYRFCGSFGWFRA